MESNDIQGRDLEILKLLCDEWKFRTTTLWSLIVKFNLLSLTLILLPVMNDAIIDIGALGIPIFVLPLAGALVSIAICAFSHIEKKEIGNLKRECEKIVKSSHTDLFSKAYENSNERYRLLPVSICALQVVLAIIISVVSI